MAIKFLQTSDVHLGAKFSFLGDKASDYREQLKKTFSNTIKLAIDEDVDILLIAGDLFDSPYPSNITKDFVNAELNKLTDLGKKVAIIAGNHDLYESGSVWSSGYLADNLNIRVFKPNETAWELQELDLTIHGVSNSTQKSSKSPLSLLVPNETTKHNIALVHGSYVIEGKIKDASFPITSEDIEKSKMNYIAMGDWHGLSDYSTENTKCFYSGSPEPLNVNQQKSGSVLIGTIDNEQVIAKSTKVGRYSFVGKEVGKEQLSSSGGLVKLLESEVGKNFILRLSLESGLIDLEDLEIQEWLKNNFYAYIIKEDASDEINPKEIEKFSEDEIVQEFMKNTKKFIDENEKYKGLSKTSLLELLRYINAAK